MFVFFIYICNSIYCLGIDCVAIAIVYITLYIVYCSNFNIMSVEQNTSFFTFTQCCDLSYINPHHLTLQVVGNTLDLMPFIGQFCLIYSCRHYFFRNSFCTLICFFSPFYLTFFFTMFLEIIEFIYINIYIYLE